MWCYSVGDAVRVSTMSEVPIAIQATDLLQGLLRLNAGWDEKKSHYVRLGLIRSDPAE